MKTIENTTTAINEVKVKLENKGIIAKISNYKTIIENNIVEFDDLYFEPKSLNDLEIAYNVSRGYHADLIVTINKIKKLDGIEYLIVNIK